MGIVPYSEIDQFVAFQEDTLDTFAFALIEALEDTRYKVDMRFEAELLLDLSQHNYCLEEAQQARCEIRVVDIRIGIEAENIQRIALGQRQN